MRVEPGVAPEDGGLLWEYGLPAKNMPLGVASPVLSGDTLFVTGFYDGCALLKLSQEEPGVEELWRKRGPSERRTRGLHSIISTPIASMSRATQLADGTTSVRGPSPRRS